MSDVGFVSVPVVPTFKGMSKEFSEKLLGPAKKSGEAAGKFLSDGVADGLKNLESQVAASQRKLDELSRAVEKNTSKQKEAKSSLRAVTLELAAAEEKYHKAVDSGKTGTAELAKVERAKTRVAAETRKLADAEADLRVAEKKHGDQLLDLARTSEKYRSTQDGLNSELEKSEKLHKRFGRVLTDLGGHFKQASKDADGLEVKLRGGLGIGAMAGAVSAVTTSTLGSLSDFVSGASKASDATDKFKATLSFAGLDTSAIDQSTKSAQAYADATVYELSDIQSMMAQLSANGIKNYEELSKAAGNLNAVAGGNADTFKSVGMVMSQTAGAGKLTTENWNQLADAIPGASGKLQEALLKNGAYVGNFRDAMADGQISAEEFNQAVLELGSQDIAAQAAQSTSTFEGMFGNLKATLEGGLADAFTVVKPYVEEFTGGANDFAEVVMPKLSNGIEVGIEKLKIFGDWIQKNKDWLEPTVVTLGAFAGAIGTVSLALKTWAGAVAVYSTVTKIATGETLLFNMALKTNVIIAVVSALVALVAGLTYFFTQTETGKRVWQSFMELLQQGWQWLSTSFASVWSWIATNATAAWESIKAGWQSLTSVFMSVYDGYIKPVFDAFVTAGKWLAVVVTTLVVAPIVIAWNLLSAAFSAGYNTLIKPVLEGVGALFLWLWNVAVSPVLTWITDKWNAFTLLMQLGWAWLNDNVFRPMGDGLQWLSSWFQVKLGEIQSGWEILKAVLHAGWIWVDGNVFGPVRGGIAWVADWFSQKITDISGHWETWKGILHAGWIWVDANVFSNIKSGLDVLQGWFQAGVDSVGRIWNGLRKLMAEPINFVVSSVYNDGLKKVFNSVAEKVKLDSRLPDIAPIAFATGGILPGYTPGRDPYTFIEPRTGMKIGLSGGEAILRPEATRALGKDAIDALNRAARTGGVSGVKKLWGTALGQYANGGIIPSLGSFSSGGVIDSITALVNRFFPGMTITSTVRPGDPGYHGRGLAVDFSDGTDTTPGMQAAAKFFHDHYGIGLAELIHWPLNGWVNIKNGGPLNYGEPTNSQHRNHVHIAATAALGEPDGDVVPFKGGGGFSFDPLGWLTGLLKPALDLVIPKFPQSGDWGDVPGMLKSALIDPAIDGIKAMAKEFAGAFMGAMGMSGNAESWREMAMEAMRRNGFNADDPRQVEAMLRQIQSESGGNPGIAQQIVDVNGTGESAGVGLLQIIPGTFAAHRDPELPNDRRDPWANMNAALRYYRSRYGSDLTTMWGHGHGYADGGILPGFTPGVDVHKFWSPTAGWLHLSGGEAIMRPEFTAAIGEAGVDSINSAAASGDSRSLAYALGGVFPGGAGIPGMAFPPGAPGADIPQRIYEFFKPHLEHLQKVADHRTDEGIIARSLAKEFAIVSDIVGLPEIAEVTNALLNAEHELIEAEAGRAERLADIADKESALAEAQKALMEAQSDSVEMSVQDKRKLEDAMKAVEDAKKPNKKGEVDADKVAKAEEKLARVREDLEANGVKDAEKRAEDIKKANETVAKAEGELMAARKKSAEALDMPIHSLMPQLHDLANAGAAAASQNGLGGLAAQLSNLAFMAGPSGVSVGVAVQALKTGISLIKQVAGVIKKLIERVRKSRMDSLENMANGFSVIAQYAKLVAEMQAKVSGFQQELVQGANDLRAAQFALKVALQDRIIAEAEGAIAIAQARINLDKEIAKGTIAAQIKLMGLYEDWDSYRAYEAQVSTGVLKEWSDTAISALMSYEASRAKALQGELQARVAQIKAEFALAEATRKNAFNQAQLLKAQERLIRMSAEVAGIDLVEATGGAQIAKLMVEMAQVQQAMKGNILGRWGAQMGVKGNFANEYRGQQAQYAGLEKALAAVLAESGVTIDQKRLDETLKLMSLAAFRGGDTMAVLRARLPELAAAETALKINESLQPIYDAQDQKSSLEKQIDDLRAEVGLFEQVTPLEETVKGLDYTIKGLEYSSQAFAEGNDQLRAEYLAAAKANADAAAELGVAWKMDGKYASAQDRISTVINVHLDGRETYSADEVDALLAEIRKNPGAKVNAVWSSSDVVKSRLIGVGDA